MAWRESLGQRLAIAKKHERTPEERALVRRLDLFLMTFGFVSQLIKYLDQTNINNAYVSGMKEDLELYGNELNYFTTFFNIGYIIMLIPSQIIITYVRPSLWLTGLEISWGIMTGLLALVQKTEHVYALRFFVGLFESGAWPGMMTIFMYWYTPGELAKRMGLYHSAQQVGAMMSGALQIAILNTLDGSRGIAGWRWLFIINSIMTVILGVFGFFMLPDMPDRPNPWAKWFTKEHSRLSVERLSRHGRIQPGKITWQSARRALSHWATWLIPVIFWTYGLGGGGTAYFGVFLKSLKDAQGKPVWNTTQVNAIPIGGSAVQVVALWVWSIVSDLFGIRWQLLVLEAVIGFIPCIIMILWTQNPSALTLNAAYASYFMIYACNATAVLALAWATDLLPHDPDARALIVGICVTGIYAINTGAQVGMWPASQAPYYKIGWPVALSTFSLGLILVIWLRVLDGRYLLPKRLAAGSTVLVTHESESTEKGQEVTRDEKKV